MTTDERVDDRDPGGDADAGVNDKADASKADASDVVEGPIGGAALREPSEIEADGAGADLASLPEIDDEAGSQTNRS